MSDLEIWIVIFSLWLATFIARSGFWLAGNRINLPQRVQEALRYAPACALAAIIVPDFLLNPHGGSEWDFSWQNPKLMAGIAATVFFQVRKNMLHTIIFGMLVFTGLRLL
ncbi:AzlD domain-containing protein [Undibacterium jejuense]|uniref:AzlD domain-containing protein n=1 Tax=Undibacterium jejuense TaxID=1344949 RepID=A0A923HKE0_9BURK|nr:AzlD domain-containing protein [Undibacterium jejuense]MBC3863870.1 AzlD domain-containing protein [Undibacterium jejuense]